MIEPEESALPRAELEAWEAAPLDDAFEERVMARLGGNEEALVVLGDGQADEVAASASRRSPASAWWVVAAAAAVAATVAMVALRPKEQSVRPAIEVAANPGLVVLPNGVESFPEPGADVDWNAGQGRVEQRKGSVRYRVPSGTPFLVATAAANIRVRGTDFTVEVLEMNESTKRNLQAVGALAMGAAAVSVYVSSGSVEVENDHGTVTVDAERKAIATDAAAPRLRAARKSKKSAKRHAEAAAVASRKAGRAKRDVVAKQIALALQQKAPSGALEARDESGKEESFGTLDKEYIRAVVTEDLVPLVRDCYDDALSRDPDVAGKLVLNYAITGDESVGGVVESVELTEDSTIADEQMRECVTESTMSIVFDPPEGGGKVIVTYPFVFEPESGEDKAK